MRQRFRKLAALGLNQTEKTLDSVIAGRQTAGFLKALVGGIEFLLAGLEEAQIDPACGLIRCDLSGARQAVSGVHIFTRLERRQAEVERGAQVAILWRPGVGERRP